MVPNTNRLNFARNNLETEAKLSIAPLAIQHKKKHENVERTRSIIMNKTTFEPKTTRDKNYQRQTSEDNLPNGNKAENTLAETF